MFHNDDECELGGTIAPAFWRAGDGGLPLCPACARLNAATGRSASRAHSAGRIERREGVANVARRVMVTCPKTGRAVWTGLSIAPRRLAELADRSFNVWCSACGANHQWSPRDAWLADDGDDGSAMRTAAH